MKLHDYVERFTRDVIADALLSAQALYWRERAAAFEAAIPRDGDYLGRAGSDGSAATQGRLTAKAEACGHHADLIAGSDL